MQSLHQKTVSGPSSLVADVTVGIRCGLTLMLAVVGISWLNHGHVTTQHLITAQQA